LPSFSSRQQEPSNPNATRYAAAELAIDKVKYVGHAATFAPFSSIHMAMKHFVTFCIFVSPLLFFYSPVAFRRHT
jgi:hypothetical protein